MSLEPLDGPAKQFSVSLSSTVVVKVEQGGSPLTDRKVIVIMPLDGKIWVYFGDNNTVPNAATVKANGFPHFTNAKEGYEASSTQELYIVADTGTVDVRIAERA